MSSREQVLNSVGRAIADAPKVQVRRNYARYLDLDHDALIELLVSRVRDYKADVRVISAAELAGTIGTVLGQQGAASVVVPADLDPAWLTTTTCKVVRDHPALDARSLDQIDAVITASAVTVALTGTIMLDGGPGQGRRVVSLIPDLHLCVVPADTIVGTVPEAVARLNPSRPMSWISGPSATSDIELDRVEGVHGPRRLVVLVVVP